MIQINWSFLIGAFLFISLLVGSISALSALREAVEDRVQQRAELVQDALRVARGGER